MYLRFLSLFGILFCLGSSFTLAESNDNQKAPAIEFETFSLEECLKSNVVGADETMTVAQLKEACVLLNKQKTQQETPEENEDELAEANKRPLLKNRLTMEALNRSNRFLLTPHKRNYFFPASYSREPNIKPYEDANSSLAELNHTEAEFQLSIKILMRENIFGNNGHLYLGYTNHSLWQVYSDYDSAPFRESDHEPEFILSFTNDWEIFGFRNALNEISINHQSNGQGGLLSRSWNRLLLNTVFEHGNFVFSLKPWYRLPENEQDYPGDPDGDDNPDIEHYMGNFEFASAYRHKENIYSVMFRNNLEADNKGALELGWSFPISANLRGHLKYFNGYGYSLIDYNADQEVIALGVIFTDLF